MGQPDQGVGGTNRTGKPRIPNTKGNLTKANKRSYPVHGPHLGKPHLRKGLALGRGVGIHSQRTVPPIDLHLTHLGRTDLDYRKPFVA